MTQQLLQFSLSPALMSRQSLTITFIVSLHTMHTIQFFDIPCNIMQYHTILGNTMQYNTILIKNTLQYYPILCNTNAIRCNMTKRPSITTRQTQNKHSLTIEELMSATLSNVSSLVFIPIRNPIYPYSRKFCQVDVSTCIHFVFGRSDERRIDSTEDNPILHESV